MFKLTKRDTRTTPLAWIQNGPLTLEPILAKVPILYSLKTPENQKFSSDFRRYEIGILSKYCQYFGLFLFVSINFLLNWIWRAIYITYQSSKAFLQGKANRGVLENNSDRKFGNYDDFRHVILHNIHMDFLDLS